MKEPTQRQREVLAFISGFVKAHSYPPAMREIADHFSISVKAAHDRVSALIKKGCLRHEPGTKRARALEVVHKESGQETEVFTDIPIMGVVAAGMPTLAEENREGTLPIHNSFLKKGTRHFILRVRGDSMRDAGILEGDLTLIQQQSTAQNGEIVVAVVEEAVTLKRFFKESTRIRLQPENPDYQPLFSQDVQVLGKLVCVIRRY